MTPKRLKKAREARGLSMQELAQKAGVSASTIHYFEKGKTRPRGRTLRRILTALEKTSKLPVVK